jgi:hypothetical protein
MHDARAIVDVCEKTTVRNRTRGGRQRATTEVDRNGEKGSPGRSWTWNVDEEAAD